MLKRIHLFFSTPAGDRRHPAVIFWFCTALIFAACYSLLGLKEALSSPYVIADDARQHLFWVQRLVDPDLFPNDIIADYYQSIAPDGYTWLYRIAASLGLDPLIFNKILPVPLSLLGAALMFWLSLELFPYPSAAFISSLLLSQGLSMTDAVFSGTPKAFLYVSFLLFAYGWVRKSLWLTVPAIVFAGFFYPPTVLIAAGIMVLGVVEFQGGRFRILNDRLTWIQVAIGVGVAFVLLLPYAIGESEFGPTISHEVAQTMPEFMKGGRTSFYGGGFMDYWFNGRSGMRLDAVFTPVTGLAAFLWLLLPWFPQQFPLTRNLRPQTNFLPRLLLTSLTLFFAAHLLLFTLYLPSRYTGSYLRIFVSIAAAMALFSVIDALLRHTRRLTAQRSAIAVGRAIASLALVLAISIAVVGYSAFVSNFPLTYYVEAGKPELYQFLASQPKETLVVTLSNESANIPLLSRRSVLVSREFALPYHVGYYDQIRPKIEDTIRAQYSSNPSVLRGFLEQYKPNLWLLERQSFVQDDLARNRWLAQFEEEHIGAISALEAGEEPLLSQYRDQCSVFSQQGVTVLSINCIQTELNLRFSS